MDTIREHTFDATNPFSDYISPGKCAGLYLVFSGTAKTGITGDFDSLGSLTVRRNDETQIERPMGVFKNYWDLRAGSAFIDSTTAGAFEAAVIVPFWLVGLENAYNLSADELEVSWSPVSSTQDGTNFSDLTLTVAKLKTNWQENYLFRMLGNDENVTSGTSSQKFSLKRRNIAEVLLRDPDSVLDKAGLLQEDRPIYDEQGKTYYTGLTISDSQIEAATFPMIRFKVYDESEERYRARASVLNKNSQLQLSASGAGTIEATTVSIVPKQGVYLNV